MKRKAIKILLSYYMRIIYPMEVHKDSDEGKEYFVAEFPDLPGCGSWGNTKQEAIERAYEAKELWIETSLKRGLNIPE